MRQSLVSKIYLEMKLRIITGQYPPEMVLSEPQIAEEFGSSKTPAREAMTMLTKEGYLLRFPGRGYAVRDVGSLELKEMQVFRRTIEIGMLEQIVKRSPDSELRQLRETQKKLLDNPEEVSQEVNIQFHLALARLSENRFFIESMERAMVSAARGYYRMNQEQANHTTSRAENVPHLVRSHTAIVDALLAHDLEDAIHALDHDYEIKL